jgi:hypothetical protein
MGCGRSWKVMGGGEESGKSRGERGEGRGERREGRGESRAQTTDARAVQNVRIDLAAESGGMRQNAAESGAERQEHRCGNDDDSLDFLANESVTSQTPRDLRPRLRVQPFNINQTQIMKKY